MSRTALMKLGLRWGVEPESSRTVSWLSLTREIRVVHLAESRRSSRVPRMTGQPVEFEERPLKGRIARAGHGVP